MVFVFSNARRGMSCSLGLHSVCIDIWSYVLYVYDIVPSLLLRLAVTSFHRTAFFLNFVSLFEIWRPSLRHHDAKFRRHVRSSRAKRE